LRLAGLSAFGADQAQEIVGVSGVEGCVFAVEGALADEVLQRFFLRDRAFIFGHGDFLVQVLQGVPPDVLAGAIADDQQLGNGNTATELAGQEHLREDGGERHGKFLADGGLTFGRERIGDAGDGRGDVGGVQGGEDEVSGFGGGDSDAHGFGVAHLADDEDVGSLPEGGAQGGGEVGGVDANFDLLDHAAQVGVLVLDRVFDGDDVAGFAAIDFVHESGDGGGLSGAGGASDEDQSAGQAAESFDCGREVEFVERWNACRERAHGGRGVSFLAMQVDAESADAGDTVGRVGDVVLAVLLQGARDESGQDGLFDLGASEDGLVDGADFAFEAN